MTALLKNKTLVIDLHYFPCISYYITLIKFNALKIEQYEHYQKGTYRNRSYLAGPNGRILISIPLLKGKNQRTVVKSVRIANDEKWQSLHWKTLSSAYRRSPWFEYYEESLHHLYEKKFNYLMEWNLACFEWTNQCLGGDFIYSLTDAYHDSYEKETDIVDYRDKILPVQLKGANLGPLPRYTQVFEERVGFLPNLSILDLLFCEGKHARRLLEEQAKSLVF